MKLTNLAGLALKHVRNAFAEELYLRTQTDLTRPIVVYGMVNEWCNYKCRYCDYWRLKEYREEMTIEEWQKALLSLKEFIGPFHIEYSGGEPYIKKGFRRPAAVLPRPRHPLGRDHERLGVHRQDYQADSRRQAVQHQHVDGLAFARGPQLFSRHRRVAGTDHQVAANCCSPSGAAQKQDFPVIIKPVVHKLNFRQLPDMVDWVKELGATAVNFQPVDRWTKETYDELWIGEDDMPELIEVRDKLLAMKKAVAPILNSELILGVWPEHFREAEGTAGDDALPGRDAELLHPSGRQRRGLLVLSADRQRQDAVGPRHLVRRGGEGTTGGDGRLRQALPVHLPVAEDGPGQGQDGADAADRQPRSETARNEEAR